MSVRDVGVLLLKLWGLVSLVRGVVAGVSALLMSFSSIQGLDVGMARYAYMTTLFSALVQIGFGVFLLLRAEWIAALITPEPVAGAGPVASVPNQRDLQAVLFGAVGAFLMIAALRDIGGLVYAIVVEPEWEARGGFAYMLGAKQEELVGAAVQLVAALVLLMSRSALATAWSRIHPMGSRKD